jgi:hypothetical protein
MPTVYYQMIWNNLMLPYYPLNMMALMFALQALPECHYKIEGCRIIDFR